MARLVTLFGGGGFLGRYVAQNLLRRGVRVRIAERDPRDAWFLKPLGGLGQTQFVRADVSDVAQVARAVEGADAVVNLVGILKGRFEAIHVDGARNVAAAAQAAGADALVHVSAIGAHPGARSRYGASKGRGEEAARAAFPDATILRPSILFGPEDDFINRFARMAQLLPVVPVVRGATRFQPAFVGDVARAVAAAAVDADGRRGRTYELGGPQVLTMEALVRWIAGAIGRSPAIVALPDPIGAAMAAFGWLPGAPLTRDQWLMLQGDNVVGDGAEGFAAFGIDPAPLAALAPGWLVGYRRLGRFAEGKATA